MAVIIDFYFCAFKGDLLTNKRGLLPECASTAEFENDDFGVEMLRRELDLKQNHIVLGQMVNG